jgi:hypothetical protein
MRKIDSVQGRVSVAYIVDTENDEMDRIRSRRMDVKSKKIARERGYNVLPRRRSSCPPIDKVLSAYALQHGLW